MSEARTTLGFYYPSSPNDLVGSHMVTHYGENWTLLDSLISQLAGVENDATSAGTYEYGDLIFWSGELYKCILPINEGQILSVGNNLKKFDGFSDMGEDEESIPPTIVGLVDNLIYRTNGIKFYLNNIELDSYKSRAQKSMESGSYFMIASDVCKTIDAVTSGDILVEGRNYVKRPIYHRIKTMSPENVRYILNLIVAESLTIEPLQFELSKGDTLQLVATLEPNDSNEAVIFSSSNDDVCTVDEDGLVTATGGGYCIIECVTEDCKVTCQGTVSVSASGITLNPDSVALTVGNTREINVVFSPADATNKSVTWESSDPTIASVSDGIVEALRAGTCTITATSEDGGYSATCTLYANAATDAISVLPVSAELDVGYTMQLNATTIPAGCPVTWGSSNTNVARVDQNGLVSGLEIGMCYIVATSGRYSARSTIQTLPAVSSINISHRTLSVDIGTSQQLTATVSPDNAAQTHTVRWTSSDTSVATVNENGLVTGVALGEATITATAGNKSITCQVYTVPVVTLNKTVATMPSGGAELQLTAVVNPAGQTVSWQSSDTNKATVSSDGKVTSHAAGSVTITAVVGHTSKTCNITIEQAAETITITPSTTEIGVIKSMTLKATVLPANTVDKNITWSSSDDSIVTVDQNGVITTKEFGQATITATASNGRSGTATINVGHVASISAAIVMNTAKTRATGTIGLTIPENEEPILDLINGNTSPYSYTIPQDGITFLTNNVSDGNRYQSNPASVQILFDTIYETITPNWDYSITLTNSYGSRTLTPYTDLSGQAHGLFGTIGRTRTENYKHDITRVTWTYQVNSNGTEGRGYTYAPDKRINPNDTLTYGFTMYAGQPVGNPITLKRYSNIRVNPATVRITATNTGSYYAIPVSFWGSAGILPAVTKSEIAATGWTFLNGLYHYRVLRGSGDGAYTRVQGYNDADKAKISEYGIKYYVNEARIDFTAQKEPTSNISILVINYTNV